MKAKGYGEQDNPMCEVCRMRPAIDLHHRQFRSQGGSDDPDNLILVCKKCHAQKHGIKII